MCVGWDVYIGNLANKEDMADDVQLTETDMLNNLCETWKMGDGK